VTPRSVTLRTGGEVPGPVVLTVCLALENLMDTHPVALYEAVEMARDRAHVPFGNTGGALRGIGLLQHDGAMHDVTRDVILACADGDGFDLRLVSPYTPGVTP
jgi:hypothetical protein